MTDKIFLEVTFQEKDKVKSLGARWDNLARKWYIYPNGNLTLFRSWLPEKYISQLDKNEIKLEDGKQHLTICEIKSKIQQAIYACFPGEIWIIGEIVKLVPKNGHLHLELQDDEALKTSGQTYSLMVNIWRNKVSYIQDKLKTATGVELTANQKVRLKVKLEFHARYDLSGSVTDIDPELTMGQISLLQKKIKEKFIVEGIFDQNKALPKPKDYCRVIVIHPDNASGFHDFKSSADKLKDLCEFIYICSKFEGQLVEKEMQQAFAKSREIHQNNPVDALIMIRGGGARHGLLSLITEPILRSIILFPAPIILGLGHTDDELLIDKIVNISCGTPSKVIEYIGNTIQYNAQQALKNISVIKSESKDILFNWRDRIKDNFVYIKTIADSQYRIKRKELSESIRIVQTNCSRSLKQLFESTKTYISIISYGSDTRFKIIKEDFSNARDIVIIDSRHKLLSHKKDINNLMQGIFKESEFTINDYVVKVDDNLNKLRQYLITQQRCISERLSISFQTIEDLSPKKMLNRGYSLAFGHSGVIKDVKLARKENEFTVRFANGECRVSFKEEIKL